MRDTVNASAGYAENLNDFAANLVANGVANYTGLHYDKLLFARALGTAGRKALTQSLGYVTNQESL